MNKILLIGNSGLKHHGEDGQTVKVRLYLKKMLDEGFEVQFVDLEGFLKHIFTILSKIRKGIKECDRIVLLSAERGCKYLIPYINRHNKKYQKPFILPLIGTSVLHHSIDQLSDEDKNVFIVEGNYSLAKPVKKMNDELRKITYVLPETELLTKVFKEFYGLDNVYALNNFRDVKVSEKLAKAKEGKLRIAFLSRVMERKGIFDLIEAVSDINKEKQLIELDIYGNKAFSDEEEKLFELKVNEESVKYLGIVKNSEVVDILSKYDLFVFPTKFVGEGTPGAIVESLIAGTPVLTSNFPQAKYLLKDGKDSTFYEMFNKEELKDKLLYIINNRSVLDSMSKEAFESGNKYTYEYERKNFLKYVCGVEEKE